MNKYLKRLQRLVYFFISTNWLKVFKYYSKNAKVVVWLPTIKPKYWGGDSFIWDFSTIQALVSNGITYQMKIGRKIGQCHEKKIFYTLCESYNIFAFTNYVDVLDHITKNLEKQGNVLFLNSRESVLWENKAYMHKKFKEYNVNEPRTELFSYDSIHQISESFSFPFLIKSEHSCSSKGVFLIKNESQLNELIQSVNFRRENEVIIVQNLINMRRDLRVILVGNKIVSYYWRINLEKDWRPTSTSFGSRVDFGNFPEMWRQVIIDTFQRFNISTGAFDIAWENDNLNTEPIFLELSPVYQPNPMLRKAKKHYSYYKQNFSLVNSWDIAYLKLISDIKKKQIDNYRSLEKI